MVLSKFDNQKKSELSMIEVAREILHERHETIDFYDLLKQVKEFIGKSDDEIAIRTPQFYTDLNIDGSFISLGDNMWGLRSWYPFDSINEEIHLDLEEETVIKKKKSDNKETILDDDDVVGWDDDPEEELISVERTEVSEVEVEESEKVSTDDKSDFEVSTGIGEDIVGIGKDVDDDYGSGDIEK